MIARIAALALVATLAGCRDRSPPPPKSEPPPAAGSAAKVEPKPDPWTVKTEPSLADTVCPKVTGAYFYRIEKAGKVSHLLGTRHLGVGLYKFPPLVKQQLEAAKVLVTETGLDESDDPPAPSKSLPEQLGPALWERYRELAGDALAAEVVDEPPVVAIVRLMAKYEDTLSALDAEIERTATERGTRVIGLETSAFQNTLITRWLDVKALRALVQTTESVDEIREDTTDDLTKYCQGTDDSPGYEPEERAEMLGAGYTEAELAQFEKELLFDRNRDWIPKLEPLLAEGNAFIAVGADHLRGDRGVPALLRDKGYRVERLTPPR